MRIVKKNHFVDFVLYSPVTITAGNPDSCHTVISMDVGKFAADILVKLVNHVANIPDIVSELSLHGFVNSLIDEIRISFIPISAVLQFCAILITTCPEGDVSAPVTNIGRVNQSTINLDTI